MDKNTQLEQNNLDAQISLMKDIIENYHNIIYHVEEKGKELMNLLRERTVDDNEPIATRTVSFSNEKFEKLMDIAHILQDKSKYEQLGILAKKAVPDNVIKKKILLLLQKP